MFCGKAYGRGADQPSKCVQVFSSPIIHDLFNDSSWCNEQSYLSNHQLGNNFWLMYDVEDRIKFGVVGKDLVQDED